MGNKQGGPGGYGPGGPGGHGPGGQIKRGPVPPPGQPKSAQQPLSPKANSNNNNNNNSNNNDSTNNSNPPSNPPSNPSSPTNAAANNSNPPSNPPSNPSSPTNAATAAAANNNNNSNNQASDKGDMTTESGATMHRHLTVADFELLKVVGRGSFGKVMQVRKKDSGKIYAMKVLKKQHLVARKQVAHTQTERKVLENIDHPFIVSLRFAFQTEDKLYMILDYFSGGELFFHLKNTGRFSEERAKYYAAEITLALECLHSHNIVYRDLKPENVLLDDQGHIKMTDFGLSKESIGGSSLTHTFCGTPEYLAPEVIHGAGYGKPVDWWSLGTLLYEMLTGLPPFYNQNLHVMYEKIIRAKLTFPDYLSEEAKALLAGLLDRDPKTRLGSGTDADEVKTHPFFKDIDFTKLAKKELPTPFKPPSTGTDDDTTNVDDEFKREIVQDTPVESSRLSKVNFPNFTYVAPESHMNSAPLGAENDIDEEN